MRGYDPYLEEQYDKMFNADERPRDEWVIMEAEQSVWYLNDIIAGKHFEKDFNDSIYY